jgi:thioredoxin reductase (NADPH)
VTYYDDPHLYAFQKQPCGASIARLMLHQRFIEKVCDYGGAVASIGDRVKYWVKPDIGRIKEGSIKAYFNAEISEIEKEIVIIHAR